MSESSNEEDEDAPLRRRTPEEEGDDAAFQEDEESMEESDATGSMSPPRVGTHGSNKMSTAAAQSMTGGGRKRSKLDLPEEYDPDLYGLRRSVSVVSHNDISM